MSDDPLGNLSPKKRRYVKELSKGKTKKDAAISAGYSETTAAVAKSHIETPEVREAFRELIQKAIPAEKIAQRIAEGLDAEETKFFQKDGFVQDQKNVIAWSERRAYAELASEWGGYFVPRQEISIDADFDDWTDEELQRFIEHDEWPGEAKAEG